MNVRWNANWIVISTFRIYKTIQYEKLYLLLHCTQQKCPDVRHIIVACKIVHEAVRLHVMICIISNGASQKKFHWLVNHQMTVSRAWHVTCKTDATWSHYHRICALSTRIDSIDHQLSTSTLHSTFRVKSRTLSLIDHARRSYSVVRCRPHQRHVANVAHKSGLQW
jgi:hypothetical protein